MWRLLGTIILCFPRILYTNKVSIGGCTQKQSKSSEAVPGKRACLTNSEQEELDQLDETLKSGQQIKALFCELPSNILLCSPNLPQIRTLADKYDFIVACDDTVAGFVNLDAISYVDIMVSSLTKTFSGTSNVTGGR
jgi:cystathionine beta-lyase/cystathionine gamma-synthase